MVPSCVSCCQKHLGRLCQRPYHKCSRYAGEFYELHILCVYWPRGFTICTDAATAEVPAFCLTLPSTTSSQNKMSVNQLLHSKVVFHHYFLHFMPDHYYVRRGSLYQSLGKFNEMQINKINASVQIVLMVDNSVV